jgi:group I intron endonuclease
MGLIYLAENKINGKCYVGKTTGPLAKRWRGHVYDAKYSKSKNRLFANALRKYTQDGFTLSVLAKAPNSQLSTMEKIWIFLMNSMTPNGYNLTEGGEGAVGYKFSEEDRKKISAGVRAIVTTSFRSKLSAAQKGRKHSPETRQKISLGNKGKNLGRKRSPETSEKIRKTMATPEMKKRLREAHLGRHNPSEEARKRMRDAAVGRIRSPETCQKLSDALRGRTFSVETREKISKANKGKVRTKEVKEKLSLARQGNHNALGYKHSKETRRKVSEAGKKRWAIWRKKNKR